MALKTFEDLQWNPHPVMAGIRARLDFDNDYGVSVVKGPHFYGGDRGLYELAVMYKGRLCYSTPITDDVLGWLTPENVTFHMAAVQLLPKPEIG